MIGELKCHRIIQNWQGLEKLINGIAEAVNPVSGLIDKNYLSNITTGQATQEETATFLLDINETERKVRDQFIEDCVKDSSSFLDSSKDEKLKFQVHRIKSL